MSLDKNIVKKPQQYVQPSLFDSNRNKKERPPKRTAQRKKEIQKMLSELKEKSGCVDCEVKYPYYVLDFDHTRGTKVANISQMLNTYSVEDIFKEIDKCDVVCANCHRERTYKRKNKLS